MKKTNNYYRLKQLARLGLSSQVFIPALLQELHHSIPSLSNTFCWQDTRGELCNIYDEISNAEIFKVFLKSVTSIGSDKYTHTNEWVSKLDKPTTSFDYYKQCPFVAEFYKTILLPLGYVNTCFVPIFDNTTNHRLGILMIHRTKHDELFNKDDILNIQLITSIIAEGLTQSPDTSLLTIDGWEQGIIVVNNKGELQRTCPMGEKLLSMASASEFNSSCVSTFSSYSLNSFSGYNDLINNISSSNSYHSNFNTTLTTQNSWGTFSLQGFTIDDKVGKRAAQIGLTIRRGEPFVLKLFRQIKKLSLTPRQETVGILYAAGDPLQSIANKLNLSLHTVKEHVTNISRKLQLNSRADLIELLLCN